MIHEIMTYFSPLVKVATSSAMYKNGILIPVSAGLSISFELISNFLLHTSFLGVTTGFLVLISVLIITDFITGSIASHHEYHKAKKKKDTKKAADKQFQSSKVTYTFFKFIMLFLWLWLAFTIEHSIKDIEYISSIYNVITLIPLILIALREYVSIGENLERRYKRKPYVFTFAEKFLDLLQGKFFKKITDEN